MTGVREILPGETALAARALLELRPSFETPEAVVARIDGLQRAEGYRLAGAFAADEAEAVAVAGFRMVSFLAWGERAVYVDDLITLPGRRGGGHAGALLEWVAATARQEGCDQLHLDSGVGPHRTDAHRLYFRHGLRISDFHFSRPL